MILIRLSLPQHDLEEWETFMLLMKMKHFVLFLFAFSAANMDEIPL